MCLIGETVTAKVLSFQKWREKEDRSENELYVNKIRSKLAFSHVM